MNSFEQSLGHHPESKKSYLERLASKAAAKMKMFIPALLMTVATSQSFANTDASLDDKKPKKTAAQKAETRHKLENVLMRVGDMATANADYKTRTIYNQAKGAVTAVENGISVIEENKKK